MVDEHDRPNWLRYVNPGDQGRAEKLSCPITHRHINLVLSSDRPPTGNGIPLAVSQPDTVMKQVVILAKHVAGLVVVGGLDDLL